MRSVAFASAALVLLASCTLFVSIDEDLTSGGDAGSASGSSTSGGGGEPPGVPDGAPRDAAEPTDSGTAREGCPGPPDDPDLVGWWPLDEKSGTTAHDCSARRVDLRPVGSKTPAWTDGKLGGGADFDGLDTCFTATDTAAYRFDQGQRFSVSAWVFVRRFFQTDNTGRWIASHKISPYGWHFGADDPNRLEIDYEFGEGTGKKTQVSGTAVATTWTHVAATYAPGDSAVYINGALMERKTNATIPASFKTAAQGFFHIGCRNDESNTFDGKIDDVRIYARVLAAGEIAALAARAR